MYKNLEAEIVRAGQTKRNLAKFLGITEQGFYYKLSGKSDFTLTEVLKIKNEFLGLKKMTIEELFEKTARG